jgi:hypothetical protein
VRDHQVVVGGTTDIHLYPVDAQVHRREE